MRYLITGGLGFIGSHLVERLHADGHDLAVVDDLDQTLYPKGIKEKRLAHYLTWSNFIFSEADISTPGFMRLVSRLEAFGWKPDIIVHLAALAGVRPSLEEPGRYSTVNVVGSTQVFEFARRMGCPRVISASSSSVYGRLRPPYKEDMALTQVISPYALSKLQAELTADYYARTCGLHTISLRFFTVFGPRSRPDMFIPRALQMIDRGETLTLFGDGSTYRDYTYIDNILSGLLSMLYSEKSRPGEHDVYNIGAGQKTSLLDLVHAMEEVVGKTAKIKHIEEQNGDMPGTVADISKLRSRFNYEPESSLLDGLQATWDDHDNLH
jgi:UDP-glucuronate 4-epimerase